MAGVREFFAPLHIGAIVDWDNKQPVIFVDASTPMWRCLDILRERNILSLPVADAGKTVGIVGAWDIMTYVAFKSWASDHGATMASREVFERETDLSKPVSSVIGVGEESATLFAYSARTPVDTILEHFSKGVHRTIIGIPQPHCVYTQTDLCRFLFDNKDRLGPMMDKTLEELGVLHEVKTVSVSDTALQGFRRLHQEELNSLAIVDPEDSGRLVTSLSASDIRGITRKNMTSVLLPVLEFLQTIHNFNRARLIQPLTCSKDAKLTDALAHMLASRVHRIWIVDDKFAPVGVVTMSDVCRTFSPY